MKKRLALFIALIVAFGSVLGNEAMAEASETEAFAEVVDIYETFGEVFEEPNEGKARSINSDYRTWSQSDAAWGSIALGNSSTNMKKSGCLVTSISKLMIQCGLKNSDDFNPGVLVKWLNKNGGFTADGSLYWAKPAQYLTGFDLQNYNLLSYGTYNTEKYTDKIIEWIKKGYHMVVAVQYAGHWVAIDEAKTLETGEIYIMDSLPTISGNADVKLTERYGSAFNRIAAYKGGTTPIVEGDNSENTKVRRIYGETRYETSYKVADVLKEQLGIEKFETVIVANGLNFADALAGSYLAHVKKAPILMASEETASTLKNYINENVKAGGKVYLLGGENALPEIIVEGLTGYDIERLWGATRYETNIEILREAEVSTEDILVCTGSDFADSLSASASKRPILLTADKLSKEQKDYLSGLATDDFYIIGGEAAVSKSIEDEIKAYGDVKRIGGVTRYETSVMVAETFIENPESVVLAYALNFPDGLCGGALAASMNAPMILTIDGKEDISATYTKKMGIGQGIVLGGSGLVSDDTVKMIIN